MQERKANLRTLHDVGHYSGVEDKAARELAMAIHVSESTSCAVSWEAQQRGQDYFNEHGLAATLDEIFRLEPLKLPDAWY
jgi:hypothetical protein